MTSQRDRDRYAKDVYERLAAVPVGKLFRGDPPRCDEHARKGTGYGRCDLPLDKDGQCLRAGDHIPTDEVR